MKNKINIQINLHRFYGQTLNGLPYLFYITNPQFKAQLFQTQTKEESNKPKCPTCQSTNIRKMSGMESGASIAMFGLFSKKINKTFKCQSCGYTW